MSWIYKHFTHNMFRRFVRISVNIFSIEKGLSRSVKDMDKTELNLLSWTMTRKAG